MRLLQQSIIVVDSIKFSAVNQNHSSHQARIKFFEILRDTKAPYSTLERFILFFIIWQSNYE